MLRFLNVLPLYFSFLFLRLLLPYSFTPRKSCCCLGASVKTKCGGALLLALTHTHADCHTDTGAAATQWERRRRKMLSVLRSPFYAHFKLFAVYFVRFFVFYFIWLLVFFASFLCTVSLFLIKTRCCCCYCCLPLLVWPTLFW